MHGLKLSCSDLPPSSSSVRTGATAGALGVSAHGSSCGTTPLSSGQSTNTSSLSTTPTEEGPHIADDFSGRFVESGQFPRVWRKRVQVPVFLPSYAWVHVQAFGIFTGSCQLTRHDLSSVDASPGASPDDFDDQDDMAAYCLISLIEAAKEQNAARLKRQAAASCAGRLLPPSTRGRVRGAVTASLPVPGPAVGLRCFSSQAVWFPFPSEKR